MPDLTDSRPPSRCRAIPAGLHLVLGGALLLLAGCSLTPAPAPVEIPVGQAAYRQGEWALRRGDNTIMGRTAVPGPDGHVLTCAGDAASLIPDIPATRARMEALYGPGRSLVLVSAAPHLPHDPWLDRLVVKNRCDADGHFIFSYVPNGRYFVTAGLPGPPAVSIRRELSVYGGVTRQVNLVR